MVGISIFLLLSFCILYSLTRKIWIRLIKNDKFTVEIHFPILAIEFSKKKKGENTRIRNKKRMTGALLKYPRILSTAIDLLDDLEIEIANFILPIKKIETKYYKYHTILFSALAYIKTKAKKLIIPHDGLILSPDANDFSFDITVKTELYNIILGWLSFKSKSNKRGRKTIGK